MSKVWVNSKFFTSDNKKSDKWKPAPEKEKVFYCLCPCGEVIHEGDTVGMRGDHVEIVCYSCWVEGKLPEGHCDCAGLRFPEITLAQ